MLVFLHVHYTHITIFLLPFPQTSLQLKNQGASSRFISMSGTKDKKKKSSDEPDKKKQTDFTGIIQYSGKQMCGVTYVCCKR